MSYILNSNIMNELIYLPSAVVDSHIKLATHNQLKVLLVFLRKLTTGTSPEAIASFLQLPVEEIQDCLAYWEQVGVLMYLGVPISEAPKEKKTRSAKPAVIKPTREEIADIAATDDKLAFMLREAEMKLSRAMRSGEIQTLAWLYLDRGMDISLILMLVEYAVSEGKPNIGFIESTAMSWLNAGVSALSDAEEQIELQNRKKTAWHIVETAFGIERRLPSDKELDYAQKWIIEWKFKKDMLKEAYNRCIDQKAKLSMPYINKILETWFTDGITDISTLNARPQKGTEKNTFAAYDKQLVNRLLDNDD